MLPGWSTSPSPCTRPRSSRPEGRTRASHITMGKAFQGPRPPASGKHHEWGAWGSRGLGPPRAPRGSFRGLGPPRAPGASKEFHGPRHLAWLAHVPPSYVNPFINFREQPTAASDPPSD
eukprot:9504174-Pyramimonas_sp.AAC.2